MNVYKCWKCGANIEVSENGQTGECLYCGAQIVFPKAGFGRMEQADAHRKRREYEQAEAIYRSLSLAFPDDPEIWWNILLCEYGIEYIEEGNRRVPTINRMKYDSIYAQTEYQTLISLADGAQKAIYEKAASEIEDLQKRLQEIIANEKEYDVFISFKDKNDETGERTDDSVLAQNIYEALTEAGYRVFFSRITLKRAIAQEFDPKIYAALSRAPMMILVGCTKEHINSTWVKSEWSRYIKMMETDPGKFLLPVCSMMKPEDLPTKLRSLESIEANGPGYLERILNNVGMRLGRKKEERVQQIISQNIDDLEKNELKRIIENGHIALQDKDWQKATDYFEQALDISIECADAWWGKLGVLTENFSVRMNLDSNENAKQYMNEANKFATEEQKKRYLADIEKFKEVQQEYLFHELWEAFNIKTDNMKKFWFKETPEDKKIRTELKKQQDKILSIVPPKLKSDIQIKFEQYEWKQRRIIELKQQYDRIEMDNQALAKEYSEVKKEWSDKSKIFTIVPLGKLFIVDIFLVPNLFAGAKIFGDYSQIIGIILLLPFALYVVSIIIDSIVNREINKQYSEVWDKVYQRKQELDGLYAGLKKNFKNVQEYVLPQNLEEHISKWKDKLG